MTLTPCLDARTEVGSGPLLRADQGGGRVRALTACPTPAGGDEEPGEAVRGRHDPRRPHRGRPDRGELQGDAGRPGVGSWELGVRAAQPRSRPKHSGGRPRDGGPPGFAMETLLNYSPQNHGDVLLRTHRSRAHRPWDVRSACSRAGETPAPPPRPPASARGPGNSAEAALFGASVGFLVPNGLVPNVLNTSTGTVCGLRRFGGRRFWV